MLLPNLLGKNYSESAICGFQMFMFIRYISKGRVVSIACLATESILYFVNGIRDFSCACTSILLPKL